MDGQIALLLAQDGLVNGAIYALMALALVLVFSVTRVILIPQGEFVSYAALSMAMLQSGSIPTTLALVLVLAVAMLVCEVWRWRCGTTIDWRSTLLWGVFMPVLAVAMVWLWRPQGPTGQALTTFVLITPLGPLLYRLVFRPMAQASVLTLLIASVALHGVMVGLGLWFFGAEGSRTPALSEATFQLGGLQISGQSLVVVVVALLLMLIMFQFFRRSMLGKALRATAMNRVGARLMGIPTELAGDVSFALAAWIGAVSGLLIAPLTIIYYDTGFLIGLKGFVAAIFGALSSYPGALFGALLVGQLEAFASFWASAYKEVLVFTLIIPVLWWRSLRSRQVEDEE